MYISKSFDIKIKIIFTLQYEGMGVIRKMGLMATGEDDRPIQDIIIFHAKTSTEPIDVVQSNV